MAIAKVNIKCKECGEYFEIRKKCFNRTEADNYEMWASDNITLCKKCRFENKKAADMEEVSDFVKSLPEIVGKSEKQIAFAKNLRDNLILELKSSLKNISADYFREIMKQLVNVSDDKLVEWAKVLQQHCLLECVEVTKENLYKYKNEIRTWILKKSKTPVTVEMFSFVLSDAGKIIDCIKNNELNFDDAIKDVEAQGFKICDADT